MSFFSGFVLGQATARNGGNAGSGFAAIIGLIAFVGVVMGIGVTLAAFVLPVYALFHLPMWAAEIELFGGLGTILIPVVLVVMLPLAYVLGLFADLTRGSISIMVLGLINLGTILTLPHFDGSLLHDNKDISDPETIEQTALFAAGLAMACGCAFRALICWRMSQERRNRIVSKVSGPYSHAYQSRALAWVLFGLSGLFFAAIAQAHYKDYQRIYAFMTETGSTYQEGFDFIFWGSRYQEFMGLLVCSGVMFSVFFIHLITQRFFAKRMPETS